MEEFFKHCSTHPDFDLETFEYVWYDGGGWNDEKYCRLELSMRKILDIYPKGTILPRDIAFYLYHILDRIAGVQWWRFEIKRMKNVPKSVTIHDRICRLSSVIAMILRGEAFNDEDFVYNPFAPHVS